MLEFPESSLLSLSELGESLLDQDDVGKIWIKLCEIVDVTQLISKEIVCEHSIVEINNFSKMCVDNESSIINSEVFFSCNLNLNLSKLLSNGSSTGIEICINVLNI
jgi:hypothetical protein